MQDINESLETLLNVYNYADILVEGAFPAIECRLAHMNVSSHYCLTFSANDCVVPLNEIQKVYLTQPVTCSESLASVYFTDYFFNFIILPPQIFCGIFMEYFVYTFVIWFISPSFFID